MQNLVGKVIQFDEKIVDMEAYPDPGMRARIVSIVMENWHSSDIEDHTYVIKFDYSEFEDFNKSYEVANWWLAAGDLGTARDAGAYSAQETIYFGSPELYPFDDYFKLVN